MNILVTGSKGFIAKNLIAELKNRGINDIFEYNRESDNTLLEEYCKNADFVFHLAGVNRPKEQSEYMEGNYGFTAMLLDTLKRSGNICPIMVASSIQAELINPYGISKKAGEDIIREYSSQTGSKVYIYRLPNVFGKWCKPNYNSVIATYCHNISHGKSITINDPNVQMELVYIDDVVDELINKLIYQEQTSEEYCQIPVTHKITLGEVVELIYSFRDSRENLSIPNMSISFAKKLYSTYLSYLPNDKFSYELKMNKDHRGSFTEFIKSRDRGQVSVNISKPGIVKGNHWHHTKNEKFLVVSGKGVIRFRNVQSDEILEYYVSDHKLEVVDIPTGYTHNIENLGDMDMVTIMWANEYFDPESPDTYYLEV